MDNQEQGHKRRVRYQGTHPKSYKEKYKEFQPEKYADTIEKVLKKGSTPAGMHISICVKEIIEFLQIKPGQIGLDATLGYGGHTMQMLKCLESKGHIYALDVDSIEIAKTKKRLENLGYGSDILTIKQMNFANIDQLALGAGAFNFVLADLGVSSMQIDNPDRGFTYKKEGPLDLRLDPTKGIAVSERLREISQQELEGMLKENADEPYAKEISRAITSAIRRGTEISTTTDLQHIIEEVVMKMKTDKPLSTNEQKDMVRKSCQRTFQALRIDANNEFEVLEQFLERLPEILAPEGRVAILTFHSGEDRLVKKSFKRFFSEGVYCKIASEVIRPSAKECNENHRARSTKMRWAIKA